MVRSDFEEHLIVQVVFDGFHVFLESKFVVSKRADFLESEPNLFEQIAVFGDRNPK